MLNKALVLPLLLVGLPTTSSQFTCDDRATKTNLMALTGAGAGHFCSELDGSHPGTLALVGGGSCNDYYMTATSVAGGVRFCYLDGVTCKKKDVISCPGAPPGMPSPSPPPPLPPPLSPPAPPAAPPGCASRSGKTDLATLTGAAANHFCFELDASHPGTLAAVGGGSCSDYYTTGAAGVRFCYLDGSNCKAMDAISCFPPPSPPPPVSSAAPPSSTSPRPDLDSETTQALSVNAPPPSSAASTGLGEGAIIGIVIATLAVTGLLGYAAYYVVQQRKPPAPPAFTDVTKPEAQPEVDEAAVTEP